MMNKIKRLVDNTRYSFRIAQKCDPVIGMVTLGDTVIFRNRGSLGKKCSLLLHKLVQQYLGRKYGYVFDAYNTNANDKETCIKENDPIWIFWWQGIKGMPDIIYMCVESIKRNAGKHPVILLDKDNYMEYVEMPDYILEKLKRQEISITHFSDALRFQLLYSNGGIWVDASLYAVGDFTKNIKGSFYTVRHGKFADSHVCMGLWSTFFLAAGKGNSFMMLVRDVLFEYLKNEEIMITYFLIDCIMAKAYSEFDCVRELVQQVPINNINVFELFPLLNSPFDKERMRQLSQSTDLFKLSYKNIPNQYADNSYYNKVIHEQYIK